MSSIKHTGISILVILALMVSMMAVIVPSAPAQATATGVTVIFPTGDNTTLTATQYIKQNGTFTVRYTLDGDGTNSQVVITVYNVTYGTVSQINLFTVAADNATHTNNVTLNPVVTAGIYNLKISVDSDTVSATKLNAVVVDNTAPVTSLLYPTNSGLYYMGNSTQNIQWTTYDAANTSENVTIKGYYSTNGGSAWTNITGLSSVSWQQGAQTTTWTVPMIDSALCLVRLSATDVAGNTSDNKTSANTFTILNTPPTVSVTTPAGTEIWDGGSSHDIVFSMDSAGPTLDYLLELQVGGVPTENITPTFVLNQTKGIKTFNWATVSNNIASTNCRIRVVVRDLAGVTAQAYSGVFTIKDTTPPNCSVTTPAAGATKYSTFSDNITFNVSDNVAGNVSCTFWYTTAYTSGCTTCWSLLGSGSYAQGARYYTWTIPSANSSTCNVKIDCTDLAGNTRSVVGNVFSINSDSQPPTIAVCSPALGDVWQAGTAHNITWTSSDQPDTNAQLTYKIELSIDNGITYLSPAVANPVGQQAASCTGTYSWAVSDNPSTLCKIKITATDPAGNSASATSGTFTITTNSDCAVTTGSITLYGGGWNLISLPLIPTNTAIENVLSTALSNVISVQYYVSGTTWYDYTPGAWGNTLSTMEAGKAYWVKMGGSGTYSVIYQGRKGNCAPSPCAPTYTVTGPGWRMIGFKSSVPKSVQSYLSGTCGTTYMSTVNGYDRSIASPYWTTLSCTDNLTPGMGYWINFPVTTHTYSAGCD